RRGGDSPVGADAVEALPGVVRRRDLEDADDAGLAVDLDVGRMRDQLRSMERLEPEPSDTPLGRFRRRSFRQLTRALAVERAAAGELGDRDRLLRRALDADRAL